MYNVRGVSTRSFAMNAEVGAAMGRNSTTKEVQHDAVSYV
jgi:hypothetical protein